jgi:nicotinate-nucleotide adenylyltransferase
MVRLAVAGNVRFAVSRIEIDRPGFSYTLDTLRAFARDLGPDDSLSFIIGLDAFREIGTWKDYPELFPLADFIVTSRPGSKDSDPLRGTGVAVKKLFCYDETTPAYRHSSGHRVLFVRLTDIDISASEIRNRVAEGKSIRYLLPDPVEAYIAENGLYRNGARERQ